MLSMFRKSEATGRMDDTTIDDSYWSEWRNGRKVASMMEQTHIKQEREHGCHGRPLNHDPV